MRNPDEVRHLLLRRFDHDHPDWARGGGTWPLRISLQPPSTAQRSADPVACHAWSDLWHAHTGPGTVEYANLRFPTGTHPMPSFLTLNRPADVAAASSETAKTWLRCGQRLVTLQGDFPDADFTGTIRRITDLDEQNFQRLRRAVTWLRSHPSSGMLLRQLPIEGIDTKWLARHAFLVLRLLGNHDSDLPEQTEAAEPSRRLALHERLGLRVPPDLVQVAVLDPAYRGTLAGMRHLAASIDDLNRWPFQPRNVVIIENKETGYALTDDYPGTIAMHGLGCSVAHYARISWVRAAAKVLYWGDIDTAGLHFVNDLRARGIPAQTILMDVETLDHFAHLAVEGAAPFRGNLHHLNHREQALYGRLVEHSRVKNIGLLLEQERIPWLAARAALDAALCRPSL